MTEIHSDTIPSILLTIAEPSEILDLLSGHIRWVVLRVSLSGCFLPSALQAQDQRTSSFPIPLTSAPALKKRPSPVSTVKIVSGCSLRRRSAEMVFSMMLPPKEFSALGRLNYVCQTICTEPLI
jgi:hypothetical protein